MPELSNYSWLWILLAVAAVSGTVGWFAGRSAMRRELWRISKALRSPAGSDLSIAVAFLERWD
jgi:hypothetical protein